MTIQTPRALLEALVKSHTFEHEGSPAIALRLADQTNKQAVKKFVLADPESVLVLHDLKATGSIFFNKLRAQPQQKYMVKGKSWNVSVPLLFAGAPARHICKPISANVLDCRLKNWHCFPDSRGPDVAAREIVKLHAQGSSRLPLVPVAAALIHPTLIDLDRWCVRG